MIEVITGVMFSGKTEELIRRIRRCLIANKDVAVFKSQIDDRYEGEHRICTHDGRCIDATPVEDSWEILEVVNSLDTTPDVVAVDEAQFFDRGLPTVVETLAWQRGIRVIIVGTDMDFARRPFGPMGDLLTMADTIDKLNAICVKCGGEAYFNQRLVNGQPAKRTDDIVRVGGSESYEARCLNCFELG